jgi:hypothetical protein
MSEPAWSEGSLRKEGLEEFDPAQKRGPEASELSLEAAQAGEADLDPVEMESLSNQQPSPEVHTQEVDRRVQIDDALAKITKATGTGATEHVLRARYGLNGDPPQTLQEIAEEIPRHDGKGGTGVNRSVIAKRENFGRVALRKLMGGGHPLKDYEEPLDRS